MTENELEHRLLAAFRETYVSRAELADAKAEVATLRGALERTREGNGALGLHPMNLRLDRLEQKAAPRERIRMHIVTVSIGAILTLAITWGVGAVRAKMFVEPVAKEVTAVKEATTSDQTKVDALERKIDLWMKQQQAVPVVAPVPQQPNKYKPTTKHKRDGALIQDELLARPAAPSLPVISFNRGIPFEMMRILE